MGLCDIGRFFGATPARGPFRLTSGVEWPASWVYTPLLHYPTTPPLLHRLRRPPPVEALEPRTLLSTIPLAPGTEFGGVASPAGIAVADFDGSGTSDVAVAGTDPNTGMRAVAVYLNGAATPVFYDLPGDNSAQDIITGDFNGDGKTDLAVSDPVDGTVSVLLGNGDGTFQTPITTPYGTAEPAGSTTTAYLATADFNGDGMEDLAVADPADHQIAILLGNGAGGFTPGTPITSTEPSFDPQLILTADFNNDQVPDLVYSDGINPDVYLALGATTETGAATGLFAAPTATAVGGAVQGLATADINVNGLADLVATVSTGAATGTVDVVINTGGGVFAAATPLPTTIASPGPVAIGELNGDGLDDIVTINSSGALDVFPGMSMSEFGPAEQVQATSGSPQAVTTADVNDDGLADIVFSETNPALAAGGGYGVVFGATQPQLSTSVSGTEPASAISGAKTSIVQTVIVNNISGKAVTGTVNVNVALSTTTSYSLHDTVIDSFLMKEKIAAGKSKSLRLRITKLPPGLAAGIYHLVFQVTDPDGGIVTTSSPGTIDIAAAQPELSGAFKKYPATVAAGKRLSASITLTNTGNVPAIVALPIIVDASTINIVDSTAAQLLSVNKKVKINPGKSIALQLTLLAPATPADDYLIVQLDPSNTTGDVNAGDNTFATGSPIVVS
jgi:hypothetical protein